MARLWRDWGMPDLALTDVHRALHCNQKSAEIYNTLGTILEALGQPAGAERAYERAVALDPRAAFALNNLCYLEMDGGQRVSRGELLRARRSPSTPTSPRRGTTSRSIRGEARAISRGGAASADAIGERLSLYNVGVLRLSEGRYTEAALRFDQAAAAPAFDDDRAPAIGAGAEGRASGGAVPMITAERHATLELPAPKSLEQAGLSRDLITQLVLKTLHFSGELTGTELARRLGLPFHVIEPVVAASKQQHHLDISGGALGSHSYRYRITDAGRTRAMLFLEQNHYVGVAPVPLAQYRALHGGVQGRGAAPGDPRRRAEGVLAPGHQPEGDGPARARRSTPATRCSSTARPATARRSSRRRSTTCSHGDILIPHALEVEGSIIRFFDPVNHEPIEEAGQRQPRPRRRQRPPLGPLPPADGHGRRRAVARSARAELQPDARASTARRCRRSPTAACSSSTTSAARPARRASC